MYSESEQQVIDQALDIIESKLTRLPYTFNSSRSAGQYGQIQFGNLDYEVFTLLHLDNQHRLIIIEELFRGTIDGAAVYPREVVKSVINNSSSAVIFMHNHPSGVNEFHMLTEELQKDLSRLYPQSK